MHVFVHMCVVSASVRSSVYLAEVVTWILISFGREERVKENVKQSEGKGRDAFIFNSPLWFVIGFGSSLFPLFLSQSHSFHPLCLIFFSLSLSLSFPPPSQSIILRLWFEFFNWFYLKGWIRTSLHMWVN